MRQEQLAELKRIATRIKDQDNRITADPIFIVFQKEVLSCGDEYTSDFVWIDRDNDNEEADDKTKARLNRLDREGKKIPKGWEKFYCQTVDRFVTACFTEEGAKAYISRNGHNLKKTFIYADSLFRNFEMITIRECLKEVLGQRQALLNALKGLMPLWESGISEEWVVEAKKAIKRAEEAS